MKKFVVLIILAVCSAAFFATASHALSLKMQPLIYNETIQKGEKKKGFIDISNPTGQKVTLKSSVQAFRQKDNNGGLEFYDDAQIQAGITPDLAEFVLGPRESVRMFFLIDGTKLPEGDIFAALFVATAAGQESSGVAQSVKLGTILTLVNGTPGSRQAEITKLNVQFFQFGNVVSGSYAVKNTADPAKSTGFYPEVLLKLSPFGSDISQRSPLVMSGIERQVNFSFEDSRFGFYNLSAAYGKSQKSQTVFVMTGIWMIVVPIIVALLLIGGVFFARRLRKSRRYYRAARRL